MIVIQIVTAIATVIVLASTLSRLYAMTPTTDNRIRVAYVLLCVASFYAFLLIVCVGYMPTPVEFMLFVGYATLQLYCRRERKRVFMRRSRHETASH